MILIAINFVLKKQQLIGNHAERLRFLLSHGSLLPLTVGGWGGRMGASGQQEGMPAS